LVVVMVMGSRQGGVGGAQGAAEAVEGVAEVGGKCGVHLLVLLHKVGCKAVQGWLVLVVGMLQDQGKIAQAVGGTAVRTEGQGGGQMVGRVVGLMLQVVQQAVMQQQMVVKRLEQGLVQALGLDLQERVRGAEGLVVGVAVVVGVAGGGEEVEVVLLGPTSRPMCQKDRPQQDRGDKSNVTP
jgi:hypothetical protein